MSTGERPFKGDDAMAVISALALHTPPTPRSLNAEVPAGLSDLINRLLEKEPGRRFASAEALLELQNEPNRRPKSRPRTPTRPAPARHSVGRKLQRRWPLWAGALAILIGLGGLALSAATLIRVQSEQGDYVIETDDPDFIIAVGKGGGVTLEDHQKNRKYNVKVLRQDKGGQEELEVTDADADLSFHTRTFTVKRGEKVALKAWFERKPVVAALSTANDDAWFKEVAALPAEKQVEAVAVMLKERNPGFDGKVNPKIEGGTVTELRLAADEVTDLSPVRALPHLQVLACNGSSLHKGKLADLSPLKGMGLTNLNFDETLAADLSPLKDMKLTSLSMFNTPVSDLSPLDGTDLTTLWCGGTRVFSLAPLKRMRRLTNFNCDLVPATDLSPLKGLRLEFLSVNGVKTADLSVIKDMPLALLCCDFKPERDAALMRSIKTLKIINRKPAAEFWKEVDAKTTK
jgi:hypothetical protein